MTTHHTRINLTFDAKTASILFELSKHEHKSISSLTKELVLEAIERREDKYLSILAESRDTKR